MRPIRFRPAPLAVLVNCRSEACDFDSSLDRVPRGYLNFGLSYTFGSIYNTVVNPRFGGTRGNQMMFSF